MIIKKGIAVIIISCLIIVLTAGCSDDTDENANPAAPADDENQAGIDIDFTRLSTTMQIAQLQIVLENMPDYTGQTMKIQGVYDYSFWEVTGKFYHDLIIDCASGCPKRIEIFMDTPGEYPEPGTTIELLGVFGFYNEDGMGFNFPYLAVDEIIIIQ